MLTMIKNVPAGNNKRYQELFGLSSDTKPTDHIATGSSFWEVDTQKLYMFNETSNSWVAQN